MLNTLTPKTKTASTAKRPKATTETYHPTLATDTPKFHSKALTHTEWACVDATGKIQQLPATFALYVSNFIYSMGVGLYLDKIPLVIFGGLGFQAAKRVLSSLSVNSTFRVRLGMSMVMMSPFLRTAIGPPSKASGATCPMLPPRVAPEKRAVSD